MSESVILCEGYHDRAFLAAWLKHVGCSDPGDKAKSASGTIVLDPSGKRVVGGEFAFSSKSERFIRIVPCRGYRKVIQEMRTRLNRESQRVKQGATASELDRLVVCIASDVDLVDDSGKTGFGPRDLLAMAREYDPATEETDCGDLLLFSGKTTLSLVRWETDDENTAGLPGKQTLERLVSSAMVAAHPDRGAIVQEWLDSRPGEPDAGPKEFAWSYMAGWYAESGCEQFFRAIWRDKKIVEELETRLKRAGAWRVAEETAR